MRQESAPRPSIAPRRVVVVAAVLSCLTAGLFAIEWSTLASLESKTAYAVHQELQRTAEKAVQRTYAYLEAQAAAFPEHAALHHPDSPDFQAALAEGLRRFGGASVIFAQSGCSCGSPHADVELDRSGGPAHRISDARLRTIQTAANVSLPLPSSTRRDLWIASTADSGVFLFRSMLPSVAPRTTFVGVEIPAVAWTNTVVRQAASTVPRPRGQPELEFAVARPAVNLADAADFGPARPNIRLVAAYRGTTIAALTRKQFRIHLGMTTLVLASIAFAVGFALRGLRREARAAAVKSTFLAHVSHQMKTPLAAIHLYAETLEMGRVLSTGRREFYLRRIREASQGLSRMIGEILEFSRLSDGRRPYRIAPEDPRVIAEQAVRDCASMAPVDIRLDAGSSLPAVACDRAAIQQALGNLLTNAVKYRGDSSRIDLRVARHNGHVLFSVVDHGIGIPAGEQSRIFDRFYRVEDERVQATPGSGLGLAIAREIVSAHHGEIRVCSLPGQGTTFSIALPVAERSVTCQQS